MDIESLRRRNQELQQLIAERDTRTRVNIGIGQEAVLHSELGELKSEEATDVTSTERVFLNPIDQYAARCKRKYAQSLRKDI